MKRGMLILYENHLLSVLCGESSFDLNTKIGMFRDGEVYQIAPTFRWLVVK